MSNYVYAKQFRKLKQFTVEDIYKPYRSGGVRVDGKFIPRTFKPVGEGLKEQVYENGGFELKDFSDKMDRDFFKTYKKVFDVKVTLPESIDIETTKKVDGKNVIVNTDEIVINGLSAFKVQEMLKADFDIVPPMNGDKVKFDWEDEFYEKLKGRTFQMQVTGEGLDTEYRFKLIEKVSASDFDDMKTATDDSLPF